MGWRKILIVAVVLLLAVCYVDAARRPDPKCKKGYEFEYGYNTCICCVPKSCPPPMGYTYTGSACRCPDESWTACWDDNAGKYTVCVPPGQRCPNDLMNDSGYDSGCVERRTVCLSLCVDPAKMKDCVAECPGQDSCKLPENVTKNPNEIPIDVLCGKRKEDVEKRGAQKCPQGYKKDDKTKTCSYVGLSSSALDSDTDSTVRDFVETAAKGAGKIVEGKNIYGKDVKFGVIKTVEGDVLYTIDGRKYRDKLNDVLRPGITTRAGNALTTATNIPGYIWNGAFHTQWRDTYPGEDRELKWKVSAEGIKSFYEDMGNPDTICDTIKGMAEKGKTGFEIVQLAQDKGYLSSIWETLTGGGEITDWATIPATSVKQLMQELTNDNWAQGARVYMRERASGKTPDQIIADPVPELEFGIGWGTEALVGKQMLYNKYEEMYQRYLIAKAMGRGAGNEL